jgi:hypothetical protein
MSLKKYALVCCLFSLAGPGVAPADHPAPEARHGAPAPGAKSETIKLECKPIGRYSSPGPYKVEFDPETWWMRVFRETDTTLTVEGYARRLNGKIYQLSCTENESKPGTAVDSDFVFNLDLENLRFEEKQRRNNSFYHSTYYSCKRVASKTTPGGPRRP